MIVITSFKPSSDRHLPQLPSSVRHQFPSSVGRLVCGLVFGLRARPSVGRLVCGQVMSMIRSATHLTRATWIVFYVQDAARIIASSPAAPTIVIDTKVQK